MDPKDLALWLPIGISALSLILASTALGWNIYRDVILKARITVRFTADIAAVTRDAAGTVVAGSLDDAIEARDLWTFSRDLTAAGPDWLLDETDEA